MNRSTSSQPAQHAPWADDRGRRKLLSIEWGTQKKFYDSVNTNARQFSLQTHRIPTFAIVI